MTSTAPLRPIDKRFVPPVAGVDLEQSLNYIDLDEAGEVFIYDYYTSSRIFYVSGSRPKLEQIVAKATVGAHTVQQCIQMLATWMAANVRWAGCYQQELGDRLPDNTAPGEEQLLACGYGWCNEQARLFCTMTQIAGISSRIVFAFSASRRFGHCVSEVLLPDRAWMTVDQSLGFCFLIGDQPVQASRVYRDTAAQQYFTPIYAERCRKFMSALRTEIHVDFAMAASENPLEGFANLGFHNYFVH